MPSMNPFSVDEMRNGAVLFNIALLLYMFVGLAIVCDDFFCASLEEICLKLDLSDDVAGATFMAAGGSAPEFFTSLIGVFFVESDIGFGTIVGSAVFNVLFVIGLCAYFSGFDTLPLTWYPLARDSSYYLICLAVLLGVASDRKIDWYDALVLFLLYLGYVAIMFFDPSIRKFAMRKFDRSKAPQPHRPSSLHKIVPDPETADPTSKTNGDANTPYTVEKGPDGSGAQPQAGEENGAAGSSKPGATDGSVASGAEKNKAGETAEDEEEEAHDGPPEWPDGLRAQVSYVITAPLTWGMYLTIPDARVERFKKYYMLTFWLSIGWIFLLSYVMVDMAEAIGDCIGIDDNVMGVTFLAAGTSIPDAMSSLFVAQAGHGDMALSSSIGSNVFDVTFGLPIPWLIKTAIDGTLTIEGKGMSIQVATLMFMVFAVVFSIHLYGWKISRPLGMLYFVLYFVFEAEAIIFATCTVKGVDGC